MSKAGRVHGRGMSYQQKMQQAAKQPKTSAKKITEILKTEQKATKVMAAAQKATAAEEQAFIDWALKNVKTKGDLDCFQEIVQRSGTAKQRKAYEALGHAIKKTSMGERIASADKAYQAVKKAMSGGSDYAAASEAIIQNSRTPIGDRLAFLYDLDRKYGPENVEIIPQNGHYTDARKAMDELRELTRQGKRTPAAEEAYQAAKKAMSGGSDYRAASLSHIQEPPSILQSEQRLHDLEKAFGAEVEHIPQQQSYVGQIAPKPPVPPTPPVPPAVKPNDSLFNADTLKKVGKWAGIALIVGLGIWGLSKLLKKRNENADKTQQQTPVVTPVDTKEKQDRTPKIVIPYAPNDTVPEFPKGLTPQQPFEPLPSIEPQKPQPTPQIPDEPEEAKKDDDTDMHIVKKGEHMWGINKKRLKDAGVKRPKNRQINDLKNKTIENNPQVKNPDIIHPGDTLRVPKIDIES